MQLDMTQARFPHSEIPGYNARSQLPEAYRRVLRPSSVLIVKASTISALMYLFMH